MIISNVAIKNRVTVFVLMALILVAGAISYVTLPREAAPDVPIPYVLVSTHYEGVSPADMETSVTMKIETELSGLKGVKEITSASSEGMSLIMIEFLPNVATDDALQYVRDKIDLAKAELPTDADEPVIKEINIAEFPVIMISISGGISPWRLKEIADRLEDEIENLEGALNVDVLGGLEREVRLEFDPDRVAAYGLAIPELIALIPGEHVNISAGGLETAGTRFNVRVPAEIRDPLEFARLPLTMREGKTIHLSDIAEVRYTFKDRDSFARLDGADSITVSVQKRVGANILLLAEQVKAILAEARKRVPEGVKLTLTLDYSKDIVMMVTDLENNVVSGLILVVLVLVLFMGWRTSLIVALAIPMSMLISFAVLQMLGYTLNMIVLFSLILALGMLVDNAIVIVENIFRHRQLGYGKVAAAIKGAAEVAWPVITSTATTVAAFTPLLFWPGMIGDFMKYLPATVIVTLVSSLFVAMVISPTICSLAGGGGASRKRGDHVFVRGYRRLLKLSLDYWYATILLVAALLAGLFVTYARRGSGVKFFPETDPRRAIINIRCPQGTNVRETDRIARIVEQRLGPFRQDTQHVVTNIGSAGGFSLVGSSSGPHVGNVTVLFLDFEDRPEDRPSADVVDEMRKVLADIPGAEIKVEKEKEGPPTGAAVSVRVIGEDFKTLETISEQAKRLIADVPGLVNLRSDLEAARPELAFRVDRQRAMMLGVNVAEIGNFLKMAVFGRGVGTFRQFNEEYDITVRLPLEQRQSFQDLMRLRIPTASGGSVPCSSLGRFEYLPGMGTINRVDQKRVVTLTADAEGRLDADVLADVEARLDPKGYSSFLASDVGDWPGLCQVLLAAADGRKPAPARRLWELFGRKARSAVEKAAASGTITRKDRPVIVAAVEKVLERKDFYAAEDFRGVELSDETRGHLKRERKSLGKKEVRRLNRLLLEDGLAEHITRRERIDLPATYSISYAGQKAEQEEAAAFLFGRAFPFALLLIVLILVAQFNTLEAPLIIMATVGLSTIGVLAGLLICDMPFGVIMTGVGMISLAGVVVNNAIVLLDYTRRLQRRGMDVIAATLQAGATRLRPVLLTATTTILGLVPMAVGVSLDFHQVGTGRLADVLSTRSESSQFWASMAVTVIFGLAFATLLTLVVVPTLYASLYRLAAHFGLGGIRRAGEEAAEEVIDLDGEATPM